MGAPHATSVNGTHDEVLDAKKIILIPKKLFTISKFKNIVLIDRIAIIISQLVVARVKDVVANPTRLLAVSNTE